VAVDRQTYSIRKSEFEDFNISSMRPPPDRTTDLCDVRGRTVRKLLFAAAAAWLLLPPSTLARPLPQEPQGEIIGTIEGPAIAVKGPMSVQVVGNEVKTLLRSGADVRVKSGRAKIDLTEGGSIAICGPAHISLLKAANGLTIALDSGTIHAHLEGRLALSVFTAQILAKTIAIGDGSRDVLVGFDTPGLMCVRAGRGAVRLEEQFGSQSVLVPQGSDVVLANGQLEGMRSNSALCACESGVRDTAAVTGAPEISTLATTEEVKKSATAQNSPAQRAAAPPPPSTAQPKAAVEPTYQVFMPPLRYDASQQVQEEPDPKLIVLVRRVRVRPTLIFESRVVGDPVAPQPTTLASAARAAQVQTAKPASPASASLFDRVKTFLRSLWTPSS
jgi:hypothetical protein